MFGKIVDGTMSLSECGRIVDECWHEIPGHFPHVELDEFVIMPNHVHGIIIVNESKINGDDSVGARHAVPYIITYDNVNNSVNQRVVRCPQSSVHLNLPQQNGSMKSDIRRSFLYGNGIITNILFATRKN